MTSDSFFTLLTLAGLAHIATLDNIRRLSLKSTPVNDEGILCLESILPQLTDLNVSHCSNVRSYTRSELELITLFSSPMNRYDIY